MNDAWLSARPHLRPLLDKMHAVLKLADDMHVRAKTSGECID